LPHDQPEVMVALEAATRYAERFHLFPTAYSAACIIPLGLPPRPRKWARMKEVTMFQMIDQSTAEPEDRKLLFYKIGMFIVAIAAVGGVIFLCLRSLS
jgi:hypothetical protein